MTNPDCVQSFLDFHRQKSGNPAWCKADNDNAPLLYAVYRGQWKRLVCATPTSRIGVTSKILGSSLEIEQYVRLSELGQFSTPEDWKARTTPTAEQSVEEVPQPLDLELPTVPASRVASDILAWVCRASGISLENLLGRATLPHFVRARLVAYALLHGEEKRSLPQIGKAMNKHHTTVLYGLETLGIYGRSVSEFDRNFLRAIWVKGALPVGHGAGEVPPAVVERLGALVVVKDGKVEAAARHGLLSASREPLACAA